MKKAILPLAILVMIALVASAVVVDCVRLAAAARGQVTLADQEMQKHELRLIKLLEAFPERSAAVERAIAGYQGAADPAARHDAYDRLAAAFQKSMSGTVDPTNPLDRKFMDDVAGAINRREIAQQQYDEESAAYQSFLASRRGGIARWFSSQAAADKDAGG